MLVADRFVVCVLPLLFVHTLLRYWCVALEPDVIIPTRTAVDGIRTWETNARCDDDGYKHHAPLAFGLSVLFPPCDDPSCVVGVMDDG